MFTISKHLKELLCHFERSEKFRLQAPFYTVAIFHPYRVGKENIGLFCN